MVNIGQKMVIEEVIGGLLLKTFGWRFKTEGRGITIIKLS